MKVLIKNGLLAKLLFSMFISFIVVNIFAQFAGGSGTQIDPYHIETADQLNEIRNYSNNHFIQTADIDLGVPPYNEGRGWEPILQQNGRAFRGSYNGNRYTIHNLYINREHSNYIGLFAIVEESSLINITLDNVNISGGECVAGISGINRNSSTIECSVSGLIKGNKYVGGVVGVLMDSSLADLCSMIGSVAGNDYVGGVIGKTINSTVANCVNHSQVSGITFTGGISGDCYLAVMTKSYNTGTVSGEYAIGGITGLLSSETIIRNTYNTGAVSGFQGVGGITAFNDDWSKIETCYSVGNVSGFSFVGGLVGDSYYSEVVDSFWDIESSGTISSNGGTGLSNHYMSQKSTFTDANWDFNDVWSIIDNETYPYLIKQDTPSGFNRFNVFNINTEFLNNEILIYWDIYRTPNLQGINIYRDNEVVATVNNMYYRDVNLTNYHQYEYTFTALYPEGETSFTKKMFAVPHPGFAIGNGTATSPYQIDSARQLNLVRHYNQAFFKQRADIDLSEFISNNKGTWQPIGNLSNPYSGFYDGNDFKIKNLFIDGGSYEDQGLFGFIFQGEVQNVFLEDIYVLGNKYVGGLAGWTLASQILNCHSEGTVRGLAIVGGLIGRTVNTYVNKCSHRGTVVASDLVAGGLIGDSFSFSMVKNSNSHGFVSVGLVEYRDDNRSSDINFTPDFSATLQNRQRLSEVKNRSTLNGKQDITHHNNTNKHFGLCSSCLNEHLNSLTYSEAHSESQSLPLFEHEVTSRIPNRRNRKELREGNDTRCEWCNRRELAGGLIGYNASHVLNCYSTADTNTESLGGGITGWNWVNGIVENCYSTGNVSGYMGLGGLVGSNWGQIINCYSTGYVTPTNYYGGLVYASLEEKVINSYWNMDTSGLTNSQAGKGRTTDQMTYPYDKQTFAGWDFIDVWARDVNYEINNGYPYLRTEGTVGVDPEDVNDTNEPVENLSVYPNPFNPETTVSFNVIKESRINIDIYNIKGQLVRIIEDNVLPAGDYSISWDGRDENGFRQASGVYFVSFKTGNQQQLKKIMLLK